MKRTFAIACTMIAFAISLAGCDLAQRRVGSGHLGDERADGPPKPAETLSISKPPTTPPKPLENPISQATFLPEAGALPQPDAFNPFLNQQALLLLQMRAQQRITALDSYSFRLRRRENIDGKRAPEEVVQVAVRREPFSVRLKLLNPEAKGREAIFVAGKFKDEIQVLFPASDAGLLSPSGVRWSIAPTDPKVRAMSRYAITDVGLASLVERFGRLVNSDKSDGTLKYLGQVKRAEWAAKLESVHQTALPGSDPTLPKGGERWWYFDATSGLPVLVIAHDATGEVEYFWHDQIQALPLGDDDFNPEKVWRK